MTPDLSILVCSVAERCDNFAVDIQRRIHGQVSKLSDPTRVEVIILSDNRQMTIGTKRNHLVNMASGRYTVFVDDDDDIADDYVTSLLEATESGADVLTFRLEYQLNGKRKWTIKHSIRFTDDNRRRTNTPRHTSAVRRDIALKLPFPETSYGEDADWAAQLLKVAKTEHIIDKTLYIYQDVPRTSVARQYAAERSPQAYQHWKKEQGIQNTASKASSPKTVVIIPWRDRGRDPLRPANLNAVLAHWNDYGAPVSVIDDGRTGDAQFNRSAAYNRAVAAHPDAEIFIFAESDMLIPFDQINTAVAQAVSAPGLIVPFSRYLYLSPEDSEQVRHGARPQDFSAQYVMDDGKSIGAINVVSRDSIAQIGQFDECFDGNWFDDNAVERCFRVCCGPTRHVPGDAWHLYHLPGHSGDHLTDEDKRATRRNKARYEKYRRMTKPQQIRAMTMETTEAST